MSKYQHWIGIDVSQASLQVALINGKAKAGSEIKVKNEEAGYEQLGEWLVAQASIAGRSQIILEATGIYWRGVAEWLHGKGYAVSVVNPRHAYHYALSRGRRSKTDRIDAGLLAELGMKQALKVWQPSAEFAEEIEQLMQRREQVLQMKQQEVNRRASLYQHPQASALVIEQLNQSIALYDAQLASLEISVKTLLAQQPTWIEAFGYLMSIKGIGWISATWLLIVTQGFSNEHKVAELVSYAGFAPYAAESGKRQGQRQTGYGAHRVLRRVLTMAGRSAKQYNPILKDFAQRLKQAGKADKAITTACARKLIHMAYAVVHKKQYFDPTYAHVQLSTA